MRQQRSIMGMPVQLEIVDEQAAQENYDDIFKYFTEVDERFSTYKEGSEISRINRGEVLESEYSTEMREVLTLCDETRMLTDGYFDIKTPEGFLDPSGLVKGWALYNASQTLDAAGFKDYYVEIAGDVQTRGVNKEGKNWSIGVRNPFAREEVVKVIYPQGKGIATSGTYIRGSHIYNPHLKNSPHGQNVPNSENTPHDFVSLTVIGPNVYEADRYATAAFVMGTKGMHFLESLPEFEAYAIDHEGKAVMTGNFERYTLL